MKAGLMRIGLLCLCVTAAADRWRAERLETPVVVAGHVIPFFEFAVFLLPGTPFTAAFGDSGRGAIQFRDGTVTADRLESSTPTIPGRYAMRLTNDDTGESALVHVFVVTPRTIVEPAGHLSGYQIGRYPRERLRGLAIYDPPPGFIEVTPDNAGIRVSPNFTLGEFLSKQAGGFPKYLVLRPELLLKLENILRALNENGHPTDGLTIMSGYRTPYYNKAIGNVPYSRHLWGGAADIYIDEAPKDGRMDDLNGDGAVDRRDAVWLANFVKNMSNRGEFGPRVGGVGTYGANAAHGPFIHVDTRGTRARW